MISVVILAYNSRSFVCEAVDSVLSEIRRGAAAEILVVDNASADGTLAVLRATYGGDPGVRIVANEENLGYAAGNNAAARLAGGEHLLFLNDDCVLEAGALPNLLRHFAEDQTIAAAQCALATADGSEWDTLGHYMDRWGLLHPVGRGQPRQSIGDQPYDLFGASGAALATRRDAFERCGGFDAEFGFLSEETDLCWRLLLAGWRVVGLTDAFARHRNLARYDAPGAVHRSAYYLETRNRLRSMLKNMEGRTLASALPAHVTMRLGYAIRELVEGKPAYVGDVTAALWWNVRRLGQTLELRRQVGATRRVSDAELTRRGLLLAPSPRRSAAWARREVREPLTSVEAPRHREMRTEEIVTCRICGAHGAPATVALDASGAIPGRHRILRCSGCGAHWLERRLTRADMHHAYDTGEYYSQVEDPAVAADWRQRALRARYASGAPRLCRWLGKLLQGFPPAGAPGVVLDIGCGSGLRLNRLREAGWRTVGLDAAGAAVRRAQDAGLCAGVGSAEWLPFREATFDAVIMAHSLEHTHEPRAVMREIHRVLRPGGTFTATTPNTRSVLRVLFGRHWVAWEAPRHLVLFHRAALRRLCESEGFTVTSVRGTSSGSGIADSIINMRSRRDPSTSSKPHARLRLIAGVIAMATNWHPWADEMEIVAVKFGSR